MDARTMCPHGEVVSVSQQFNFKLMESHLIVSCPFYNIVQIELKNDNIRAAGNVFQNSSIIREQSYDLPVDTQFHIIYECNEI